MQTNSLLGLTVNVLRNGRWSEYESCEFTRLHVEERKSMAVVMQKWLQDIFVSDIQQNYILDIYQ